MENVNPVFCPKCKLGFSPETFVCPSCGIELVEEGEFDRDAGEAEPGSEVSGLNLLRVCDSSWSEKLLEALSAENVPFRSVPQIGSSMMSIYVADEYLELAQRIDHMVFQSQVPDAVSVPYAKDLKFGVCPACGASLGELDRDCASCGLVMSGRGWVCTSCKGALEGEEDECPHCGEKVNWDKI